MGTSSDLLRGCGVPGNATRGGRTAARHADHRVSAAGPRTEAAYRGNSRSCWRLMRGGCMGRRHHADEDPTGRGGFGAQGVHRRLKLQCHGLPADLARHHDLRSN
jgi:hypothetical protein